MNNKDFDEDKKEKCSWKGFGTYFNCVKMGSKREGCLELPPDWAKQLLDQKMDVVIQCTVI